MNENAFNALVSERRWRQPADHRKKSFPERPATETGTEEEIMRALDATVILSRSENRLEARRVCAAIIFESQHFIASRKMLLRAMLRALLVAHGFRLLSRFGLANHGVSVRITLVPDRTGEPRILLEPDQVRLVVNQRWLDELSPDGLTLHALCDALRPDASRPPDCDA
jgi:hypothetical protein